MKAALYARVSTVAQGEEEKASIPEQIARIEEYCQSKGYEVIDRYVDIGYAGSKSKRPEFQRMLEDARQRRFDVIVAWKADRLSRGMYPAAALMEVIEPLEIKLEAVEEHLDMNYFAMLAVVGKMEIDNIRARCQMGKKARAKSGKLICGKANVCYGFDYDKETGKRVENDKVDIVRSIFYQVGEENKPIQTMGRDLIAKGILSPSGKKHWANSSLHRILTNEAYIGRTWAFTKRMIKGDKIQVQRKPKDEWVEIPDCTPAIIDEALFNKVQERLKRNKELARRNVKRDYLLRGLVRCSRCGWTYHGAQKRYETKAGMKDYLYYRCSSSFRPNAKHCDNPSWKAEKLEHIVWQEVFNVLSEPQAVLAGLRAIREDDANILNQELSEIEGRLKDLDDDQYNLLDQSLRGFPPEMIERENEKVNTSRNELAKRKAELETRIQLAKQAEADIGNIKRACEIVKGNLKELNFETRRKALEALDIKVWIDGGRVTIEGTIPVAYGAVASIPSKRNGERMPSIAAGQRTQSGHNISLACGRPHLGQMGGIIRGSIWWQERQIKAPSLPQPMQYGGKRKSSAAPFSLAN